MRTKIIILVIALVIATASLVACTGSFDGTPETTDAETTGPETTVSETTIAETTGVETIGIETTKAPETTSVPETTVPDTTKAPETQILLETAPPASQAPETVPVTIPTSTPNNTELPSLGGELTPEEKEKIEQNKLCCEYCNEPRSGYHINSVFGGECPHCGEDIPANVCHDCVRDGQKPAW